MTAVIVAAGSGRRWGAAPPRKHFAVVDGEPVIARTVRLLQHCPVSRVVIVSQLASYALPGAELRLPGDEWDSSEAGKHTCTRKHWNRRGRTTVLFGDVYYSDDAMGIIYGFRRREWRLFARPWKSELTGKPWGEPFAYSFWPGQHEQHTAALERNQDLYSRGVLSKITSFSVWRAMLDLPDGLMDQHVLVDELLTVVDDWTEDFDYREDHERFLVRRRAQKAGVVALAAF